MELLRGVFVCTLVGLAVIWDFRTRKIPNSLIGVGMLSGGIWQLWAGGLPGFWNYGKGVFGTFLVLSLLHYFRMLGAGDIKLFVVLGGFFGFSENLKCICVSFLAAAVLATVKLIKHRIWLRRLQYFIQYIISYWKTKKWVPYIDVGEGELEVYYLHFSLPILIGSLCVLGGLV